MSEYVVALYTHGCFQEWLSDPGTLEDARAFVADPSEHVSLRRQDSLRIFELTPHEEDQ